MSNTNFSANTIANVISFFRSRDVSISDKYTMLKIINTDSMHASFLTYAFRHIPLNDRPKCNKWKLTIEYLMDCLYVINNINDFISLEKPYILFKLCRDNHVPEQYIEIIFNKHKEYLYSLTEYYSDEYCFTRHMMYFKNYINDCDRQRIYNEIIENDNNRSFFTDYVIKNRVCGDLTEQLVAELIINQLQ